MQAVLVLFILSVLVDGNYCSGYLNHGRRSCIRIVVVPFVSAILTSMHLLRAMLTLLHTHTPRYIYIYIYTHIQSSTIHPYFTCPYAHMIVIYSRTCFNRRLLLCCPGTSSLSHHNYKNVCTQCTDCRNEFIIAFFLRSFHFINFFPW